MLYYVKSERWRSKSPKFMLRPEMKNWGFGVAGDGTRTGEDDIVHRPHRAFFLPSRSSINLPFHLNWCIAD